MPSQSTNLSGALERNMENCPSWVPGALTTAVDTDRGVALTIVGQTPEAERDIRFLSRYQAQIHRPPNGPVRHTGQGTGGGGMGHCPIVHPGTHVMTEDVPGGSRIEIAARNPDEADELREIVRRRIAAVDRRQHTRATR